MSGTSTPVVLISFQVSLQSVKKCHGSISLKKLFDTVQLAICWIHTEKPFKMFSWTGVLEKTFLDFHHRAFWPLPFRPQKCQANFVISINMGSSDTGLENLKAKHEVVGYKQVQITSKVPLNPAINFPEPKTH